MRTIPTRRSFWPYGIICFFAAAFTFIITFVVWCTNQREDLVANNYYDNEIRYQQQLDRLNHTLAIAAQVTVAYDQSRQDIVIHVPSNAAQPSAGKIQLYRPADERMDRQLTFTPDENGIQRLNTKALAPGLWKVRVEWTTNGHDYLMDRPVTVTNPS